MLVTKHLTVAINFHNHFPTLWKSMATVNCLVTNILQNIISGDRRKNLIQVFNNLRVWVNNDRLFIFEWTVPLSFWTIRNVKLGGSRDPSTAMQAYCAFTPQAARASKWPEVIHFQWELAASSGESGAARFGRWERRGELKSGQLYGNELWRGSAATNRNVEVLRLRGFQRTQSCKLWFRPH